MSFDPDFGPKSGDLVPGEGPNPSPIVLLGEAPGANEDLYGRPFVGEAGEELNRMLREAGLQRRDLYATNVFKIRPPDNKVQHFFASRTSDEASFLLPPKGKGQFIRQCFVPMVNTVVPELVGVGARIVIAMGNTALWAMLGFEKISAYVGTIHEPTPDRPFYVIPTYHPSAVLRQWTYRTTVIANFIKAREFYESLPATPAPQAKPKADFNPLLRVNPTLDQVRAFTKRAVRAPLLAIDVETAYGQIRTVGVAISANEAICIPFWEPPAASYWPSADGEREAWHCVRDILAAPNRKVFHNGAYDLHYFYRVHGIPVNGPIEDTMVAHHCLEPELPKGLGQLASVYLDIPEWKTMNVKTEKDGDKE